MNNIKKILFRVLGIKTYLSFVSRVYIFVISCGFFKKKYPEIYFLKKIIKKQSVCVDIGANLGYYSYFLSQLTGKYGHVFAVEPIGLFADIWRKNMNKSKYKNYTIYQVALGEENKIIKMVTPVFDGVLHHGMTKVSANENEKSAFETEVEMKKPEEIFSGLSTIDFIKIDVEGYEHVIVANMQELIKKHKPVIQSELSGEENRSSVIDTLFKLSYKAYILSSDKLFEAKIRDIKNHCGDFYFFPEDDNIEYL